MSRAGLRKLSLAAALIGACSSKAPGVSDAGADAGLDAGATCSSPCAAGLTCEAKHCVPITCAQASSCPAGFQCTDGYCTNQSCVPPCAASDVCVSGICVSENPCGTGETVCGSGPSGYCANLSQDRQNCGGCGLACPSGEVCTRGACAPSCLASETLCGSLCVGTATDGQNCGACGNVCDAGTVCSGGACSASCGGGFATCGSGSSTYCAQLGDDPLDCGGCGTHCGEGLACSRGECLPTCDGVANALCGGLCVDLETDEQNCGSCGNACPAGEVCSGGACAASCAIPLTTCAGSTCPGCASGNPFCANLLEDTESCGSCGDACTTGQVCADGQCADSCEGAAGTLCSGLCVHLATDNANCGACGNACAPGQVCDGYGVCAQSCAVGFAACGTGSLAYCAGLSSDRDDCGSCGTVCPKGQVCTDGACTAPVSDGGAGDAGPGLCKTASCADGCTCPAEEVCNAGSCQTGCLVGGSYYAEGAANPANACQLCEPLSATDAFSPVADGMGCDAGGGNFCQSGACVLGCYVGSTVYGSTELNPGNDCESCRPAFATDAFTDLSTGLSCNQSGGDYCNAGSCVVGCYIGGKAIAAGAASPIAACQSCEPATSVNSYSPVPEGTACTVNGGNFCHAGSCAYGCFIADAFYASGAANPQNSCQTCDVTANPTGWTAGAVGSTCGSGGYCSAGGSCVVGCEIGGKLYSGGEYNPAGGGCCLPAQNPTGWVSEFSTPVGYATGNSPSSLAIGDFNEDGWPDVVVADTADDAIVLFAGQADGGLRNAGTIGTGHLPAAVAAGDLNGDGHLDLAFSDRGDDEVGVRFGMGDGGFGALASYDAGGGILGSVIIADVDGLNGPDLVVSNGTAGKVSVLLSNGRGGFGASQPYPLLSGNDTEGTLAAADMRAIGVDDLIVTNDTWTDSVGLLLNDGSGGYGSENDYSTDGVETQPFSAATADFNGDGIPDVVVAGPTSYACAGLIVWLGTGQVTTTLDDPYDYGTYLSTPLAGPCSYWSVAVGDFNNDGFPDLVASGNGVDEIGVLLNLGVNAVGNQYFSVQQIGGVFAVPAQLESPGPAVGVADFNGDGHLDIAVLSAEGTVGGGGTLSILYNQCP